MIEILFFGSIAVAIVICGITTFYLRIEKQLINTTLEAQQSQLLEIAKSIAEPPIEIQARSEKVVGSFKNHDIFERIRINDADYAYHGISTYEVHEVDLEQDGKYALIPPGLLYERISLSQ